MSWTYIKNLNGTGKTMTIHTSSYALNTLRFDDDILFSEVVFRIYNSKCFVKPIFTSERVLKVFAMIEFL